MAAAVHEGRSLKSHRPVCLDAATPDQVFFFRMSGALASSNGHRCIVAVSACAESTLPTLA